jgi:opacity protein-like surface antigen
LVLFRASIKADAGARRPEATEKIMKTFTPLFASFTSVLLVSVAGAYAAEPSNFYVTADAGGIFQQDANFRENGFTETAAFNAGVRADLAVGYNLNENLALEIEPGFMWNSVDTLDGYSLRSGESIDLYSVPILVNVVYRIQTGTRWTPYVGAGIGANVGTFEGKLPGLDVSDTTASFAFQGKAGVRYALTENTSVGLAYKFLGTTDQDYSLNMGRNFTDKVTLNGVYVHGVFIDYTWNF